jgi:hypothetical protein
MHNGPSQGLGSSRIGPISKTGQTNTVLPTIHNPGAII